MQNRKKRKKKTSAWRELLSGIHRNIPVSLSRTSVHREQDLMSASQKSQTIRM
ncbi:MAG: hypothetical protein J5857_11090 [Treponema sp.]|nr:hypothetical protein [Treponema sp.]